MDATGRQQAVRRGIAEGLKVLRQIPEVVTAILVGLGEGVESAGSVVSTYATMESLLEKKCLFRDEVRWLRDFARSNKKAKWEMEQWLQKAAAACYVCRTPACVSALMVFTDPPDSFLSPLYGERP